MRMTFYIPALERFDDDLGVPPPSQYKPHQVIRSKIAKKTKLRVWEKQHVDRNPDLYHDISANDILLRVANPNAEGWDSSFIDSEVDVAPYFLLDAGRDSLDTPSGIGWDTELTRYAFEKSPWHLHLPLVERNKALLHTPVLDLDDVFKVLELDTDENYKEAVLIAYANAAASTDKDQKVNTIYRNIASVGHLKNGVLPSHQVEANLGWDTFTIELPEVEVYKSAKSYVTQMQETNNAGKTLASCIKYCHLYNLPQSELFSIAFDKGLTVNQVKKISEKAAIQSTQLETFDQKALAFFTGAIEFCNTYTQIQILIELYKEACKFLTMQPRFSKKRAARVVGCDRVVIRRLFARLEKAGLMNESPETTKAYDHDAGMPLSDARIVNLDPTAPGRWWMLDEAPGPNRTPEKRERKERRRKLIKVNYEPKIEQADVGSEPMNDTELDRIIAMFDHPEPEKVEVTEDERREYLKQCPSIPIEIWVKKYRKELPSW